MKPTLLLMAGAAAVSLAACDRNGDSPFAPRMRAVSKLDCPDRTGDLRRVSTAPDGKSCNYTDSDGSEVTLQLVAVSGNPDASLKPLETSLASLVPSINEPTAPAQPATPADPKAAKQAEKDAKAAEAAAASDAAVDAAATVTDDRNSASDEDNLDIDADDNVEVDMPGIKVHTKGENADINVFGVHIDADDSHDKVHVQKVPKSGYGRSLIVDANDNGAVVRMGHTSRSNYRGTVIYAMDRAGPQGYYTVGYVARGPRKGPLVVATVKSKTEKDADIHGHEGIFHDATRLVRRASRG